MKIVLVLTAAAAMIAPAPSAHSQQRLQFTPDGQPVDGTRERACRDRIEMVRAERGLPRLEREAATASEPLFFTALDYRIDGCGALVMRNDTSDIRPIPAVPVNRPLLMPAQ